MVLVRTNELFTTLKLSQIHFSKENSPLIQSYTECTTKLNSGLRDLEILGDYYLKDKSKNCII